MPDKRQTPAERPPKKRMSRGTRVLVIIVCVLLAIALDGGPVSYTHIRAHETTLKRVWPILL